MTRRTDQIEAKARQLEVNRPYQGAGFQLVADKQVANHADALPGEHRVYRMELFAKIQMIHFAEIRHVTPSALGGAEPSLPSRGARDKRRPVEVDENVPAKFGRP